MLRRRGEARVLGPNGLSAVPGAILPDRDRARLFAPTSAESEVVSREGEGSASRGAGRSQGAGLLVALLALMLLGGCCHRVDVYGPIPECVVPPGTLKAPDSTKASVSR